MLLARGRLHEKETASYSSYPRPSLHDSLSSLASSALDDDESPQRENYDSHEDWLCAVLDASLEIPLDGLDEEEDSATTSNRSAPSQ